MFDFDETIIDLEPQHTGAHEALCRAMNADYAAMPEAFRKGSGRRIVDDIRDMQTFFGWSDDEAKLFAMRQREFDRLCDEAPLQLMPGVERVVRELHARGLMLAVTSSAVRGAIETILRRFALRDLFALIVDGSDVMHGKPDPEAYLVTAQKLGIAPEACLVFEDSEVGVLAAKRAGAFCVGVRNPHAQVRQDLSPADVVVGTMEAVRFR
ncbi:MAG TPA: HAD family phosphatase [Thermoanaerobaculia bacterium]|nr:HAD family phosphatase [Thermoanaerobaculia bacterium]